jgi:hypothetical protein
VVCLEQELLGQPPLAYWWEQPGWADLATTISCTVPDGAGP